MERPSIENVQNEWMRRNYEKTELFAQQLDSVFQINNIKSIIEIAPIHQSEIYLKLVSTTECAQDKNPNPKKIPGI